MTTNVTVSKEDIHLLGLHFEKRGVCLAARFDEGMGLELILFRSIVRAWGCAIVEEKEHWGQDEDGDYYTWTMVVTTIPYASVCG